MGLEHSNLCLGSAFPALRGNKMMNELIFVQGFEEKQCLKCLCVLTSNFIPTEFASSEKKESDSGRNYIKHFSLILPKHSDLHGGW